MLVSVFQKIEALNCKFQKSDLTINIFYQKINAVITILKSYKETGFSELWNEIETKARCKSSQKSKNE